MSVLCRGVECHKLVCLFAYQLAYFFYPGLNNWFRLTGFIVIFPGPGIKGTYHTVLFFISLVARYYFDFCYLFYVGNI